MRLVVRPAGPADEAAVVSLWEARGLIVPPNDPGYDFRLAVTGACSDILVGLDEDDIIVGAALVGHDGHRGWVYRVATARSGFGIGRRLVEDSEAWVRARGLRRMHLMVRETNTEVMPFYEKLGFAKMPYQVMSKWLSRPPDS